MSSAKTLVDVMKPFTHVRLAGESEAKALSDFSRDRLMQLKDGGIGFDRGDDFFSLFRAYTSQYWAFAILNDDGSLAGTASLTRFRAVVEGEEKWIGYFGDLRVDRSASLSAHRQWREALRDIVRHLENSASVEHCDHILIAVFKDNVQALRSFERRLVDVKHHELASYRNLSVFRPLSTALGEDGLQVVVDAEQDTAGLETPTLSFVNLPQDSSRRALAVRDRDGRTLLRANLWDARHARTLRVGGLSTPLRMIFRTVGFFSKQRYSAEEPWIMKSLGQFAWAPGLSAENKIKALRAVVKSVFKQNDDFHFLNLSLMESDLCAALQKNFPISRVTTGLVFEMTNASRTASFPSGKMVFDGTYL